MTRISDSHVHLWNPAQLHLAWLNEVPLLNRPFLLSDFDAARGDLPIDNIVFVQCDVKTEENLAEAQWISGLAAQDPRIAAIVAGADFSGDARATRAQLDDLQNLPLVKGVRHLLQGESDDKYCLRDNFLSGVQLLAEYDFSFDLCISNRQLGAATEMVRRTPKVRFVLDHIAKPDIKNQLFAPWKMQLQELASLPNVCCKISGVVTEANLANWKLHEIRPYIEHAIEAFGWKRVMFGGDWPVVLLASEYSRWAETLQEIVRDCSSDEKQLLFNANANEFYGMGN